MARLLKYPVFYDTILDDASGIRYYGCIVQDVGMCCASGVEFVPNNAFDVSEFKMGDDITVVGTLSKYIEQNK